MPRVFGCIAVAHAILLAATGTLGLLAKGAHTQRHVVLAVFTLVLGCLLQIVVFMYFAVSGKMMRQAIHLGRLDSSPLLETDRRKRGVTFILAAFVGSIVLVTATGASHWRSGQSATLHLVAAWVAAAVQLCGWILEFRLVSAHSRTFDGVMREYGGRKQVLILASSVHGDST